MRYWIIGILFLLADQFSKYMVRLNLALGESVQVIGDFFRITYVQNTGAAFNSLAGYRGVLILLPVIFIIVCTLYILKHREEHWTFYTAMTLIISGGVGNLADRSFMGYVTDMFDFSIFPPVFNVADIGITCGCVLLVFSILLEEKLNKNNG